MEPPRSLDPAFPVESVCFPRYLSQVPHMRSAQFYPACDAQGRPEATKPLTIQTPALIRRGF